MLPITDRPLRRRKRRWSVMIAALSASSLAVISIQVISAGNAVGDTTASLAACPFWASGITPPPRTDTPWTRPLQTAGAVNFSSRLAAPTMTGSLVNGTVAFTVSRVPGAVAYRIWRDGVAVAWISDWGQATLTAADTSPCQNAYYTVVAMVDNNDNDASMGQLSQPYWLGANGVVAPGPGTATVGTTITMMVTSYNDTGSTATGYSARLGVCAVDPRVIPWGTYFTVPDYGTCFAGDIGTWIQNDTVDIWLPDAQANGWGVQHRTITIIANPYSSATPPPTPPPTSTPSPTPRPTPSPTPTPRPTGSSGTCATPWNAATAYTIGQRVSYGGHNWTAIYYSADAIPGAPTSWAVWQDAGSCTASS